MARARLITPLRWERFVFLQGHDRLVEYCRPGDPAGMLVSSGRERALRRGLAKEACAYCGEPMQRVQREASEGLVDPEFWPFPEVQIVVYECSGCGYWRLSQFTNLGTTHAVPYAMSFDPFTHTPALNAFLEEVRNSESALSRMSPTQFEVFVGSALRSLLSCDVWHVGGVRDNGIDLYVAHSESPILVQVKHRRRANSVEGVEVVKHLFATMFAAETKRGMLVTSARRFSRNATRWTQVPVLRDYGFEIELVAQQELLEMIQATRDHPSRSWQRAMGAFTGHGDGIELSVEKVSQLADGMLLEAKGPGQAETYVFDALDRDGCSLILGSDPALTLDESKATCAVITARSGECRRVEGVPFQDLLLRLSQPPVNELLHMWANAIGEELVELID